MIPDDYVEYHGTRGINLEQASPEVDQFVAELGKALKEDTSTIRETELDKDGDTQPAVLYWSDEFGGYHKELDVRADKLGRVTIPAEEGFEDVATIALNGEHERTVVRVEPRYEGDSKVALVCYLGGQ